MISGSTSALSFAQIPEGLPACACSASSAIRRSRSRLHADRRVGELLHLARQRVAGDVVEDARRIPRQRRVGREQRQVRVDLRGDRVVVAGAVVAVGAQAVALAPHHHRELGVGLVLDEAEHHEHAGALQVPGPLQVGFLVEPRLDLHEGGDVLAVLGRLDQRGDDRAVLAGAVERLLDGDDVGVLRRLAEELHHDVEALERVVDQDVLLADGREAVAAVIADAFRETRLERRELQLRQVGRDQLLELGQAELAVDLDHVLRLGLQALDDEAPELVGHRGLHLHPHDQAQPPALQPRLELAHQVLGLFLDLDVAVADQPEEALALHLAAGKQPVQEEDQEALQREEAAGVLAAPAGRQFPEPVDLGRHRHERVELLVVRQTPQLQRQSEAEVGDEGERMGRIDRQRRQHWEDAAVEDLLDRRSVGGGDVLGVQEDEAVAGELGAHRPPDALLPGHQVAGGGVDPDQLLRGREPVLAQHPNAFADQRLQARHAHHEELVEIVGRDRQEP